MGPPLRENHTLTRYLAERKLTGMPWNARPREFRKFPEIDGFDRRLNNRIQAGAKDDRDFGFPITQLLARRTHGASDNDAGPARTSILKVKRRSRMQAARLH